MAEFTPPAKWVTHTGFKRGIISNLDPQVQSGDGLRAAQNAVMLPTGYPYTKVTKYGSLASAPPMQQLAGTGGSYSLDADTVITQGAPTLEYTIATCSNADVYPSETWNLTHAAHGNSISAWDRGITFAINGGQTGIASATLQQNFMVKTSASKYPIVAIDSNWSTTTLSLSGTLIIGSDNSNYYTWDIVIPSSTTSGNAVLKFDYANPKTTVGTPSASSTTYMSIEISPSVDLVLKIANIRLTSFSSSTESTKTIIDNSANVYTAYVYYPEKTSTGYVVFGSGDSVFYGATSTTASYKLCSFPGMTITDGTNKFRFTQFTNVAVAPDTADVTKNDLYIVNGTHGLFRYEPSEDAGSRWSEIQVDDSVRRSFKYITEFKGRIFLAGSAEYPNDVYMSDANNPLTIALANRLILPSTPGGSVVTGFAQTADYLYIFRKDDVYVLIISGGSVSDWELRRLDITQGALEQECICNAGNVIYFFNGRNVYKLNGVSAEPISYQLTDLIAFGTSVVETYNCSLNYNPIRECLLLCIADNTSNPMTYNANNKTYIYNIVDGCWGVIGGDDDEQSSILGGFYGNGYYWVYGLCFYRLDTSPPTAATKTFSMTTAWDNDNAPYVDKDYERVYVYLKTQSSLTSPTACTANLYCGYNTTARQTETLTVANGFSEFRCEPGTRGKSISIKLTAPVTDADDGAIEVSGWGYKYQLQQGV